MNPNYEFKIGDIVYVIASEFIDYTCPNCFNEEIKIRNKAEERKYLTIIPIHHKCKRCGGKKFISKRELIIYEDRIINTYRSELRGDTYKFQHIFSNL